MSRTLIQSARAPKAIGPYSQGVLTTAGKLLFCSGQIPLHPDTGEMVATGDVRAQTRRVLDNLRAVLEAGGSNLESVLKTTLFLADLKDFGVVNEVYAEYFPSLPQPARATVQVAGLPRGALIEIDAIAAVV
jgi:2-iminobutanoate/2-iminopropanoate deaminase